jgi:hypothetical protein
VRESAEGKEKKEKFELIKNPPLALEEAREGLSIAAAIRLETLDVSWER